MKEGILNMKRGTWAEINLNNIKHNFHSLKNTLEPDTRVCCVVKADACLLYTSCITLFFMSFALNIYKEKQSTYQKLDKINKIVAHFAAGIGLLGCKYYFIIPCLLILHKYYMEVLFEGDLNKKTEAQKQQEIIWLLNNNFGKHIIVKLLNVSYEEVEILNLMYCKKKKYL